MAPRSPNIHDQHKPFKFSSIFISLLAAHPLLLWIISATACGCDPKGSGTRQDELVLLVEAQVDGLDPRYTVSGYGVKISRLLAAGLTSLDSTDLRPKMELAREITQPDPVTYVVSLRPDARFCDGSHVTAMDVKATLSSMLDPKSQSPYRWVWTRIRKMEVLDRHRLLFRLERPHAPFLTDLDTGILPARLVSSHPERLGDPAIVGAGPFRLVHRSTTRIELAPNPYYFGGKPRFQRVIIKTVEDDNARLIMLAGGSADLTQNTVQPLLLPALMRKRSKLRIQTGPSVTHTYIGLNLTHSALADRRVRRALAMALDKKTLVRTKLRNAARISTGILPSFHWAYNSKARAWPYDPKMARLLLDQAGYPMKNGQRLRLVYKTSSNRFRVALAHVLAKMWADIGVSVEVRPYEWGVFFADIKKRSFELFSMQMTELASPDYYHHFFHSTSVPDADPLRASIRQARWLATALGRCLPEHASACPTTSLPSGIGMMRSSLDDLVALRLPELLLLRAMGAPVRARGGGNRFGYKNPEVDFLIEAARTHSRPDLQRVIYGRVQEILALDLPSIPLWHEDNIVVARRNVKGFQILPNARLNGLVHTYKKR